MKIIFWLRSLFAALISVLLTGIIASIVIALSYVIRRHKILDVFPWYWARSILFLFNVHVVVTGEENRPPVGCLYLFNHTSNFDILALAAIIKGGRFGAKVELFSIPLFGRAMNMIGMLQITRSDRDRVLQLYQESVARVHAGESFILAAEGTRQKEPGVGAKFKGGPFIFAITGQFPIVPVVIRGAAECMPKGDLLACTRKFRHEITLQFLPPVATTGRRVEERLQLQAEVQKLMTNAYNQV